MSLLSAVPVPNPVVEKERHPVTFDQRALGIDYAQGTEHLVEGTHKVLATDGEFKRWTA